MGEINIREIKPTEISIDEKLILANLIAMNLMFRAVSIDISGNDSERISIC